MHISNLLFRNILHLLPILLLLMYLLVLLNWLASEIVDAKFKWGAFIFQVMLCNFSVCCKFNIFLWFNIYSKYFFSKKLSAPYVCILFMLYVVGIRKINETSMTFIMYFRGRILYDFEANFLRAWDLYYSIALFHR